MINSWAAAAQAMINKNADSRAGDGGRRTAYPDLPLGPADGLDTGAAAICRLG